MKVKIFNFNLLWVLALILLYGCSHLPETYDTAEYLEGSGISDVKLYCYTLTGRIPEHVSRERRDSIYATFRAAGLNKALFPSEIEKYSQYFPHYIALETFPAQDEYVFKEPATILMHPNADYGNYSFIKLPDVKTASRLSEAKTIIDIEYDIYSTSYLCKIGIYEKGRKLVEYSWQEDLEVDTKIDKVLGKIVASANDLLARVKFVNDGTDRVSVWTSYLDDIQKLRINDPGSPLYQIVHTLESTGKTAPDRSKLAGYKKEDVKANILTGGYIGLSEYAHLPATDRDWLIVVHNFFKSEYDYTAEEHLYIIQNGVHKDLGATGRTEEMKKSHYNTFYISGKTGKVIAEYSTAGFVPDRECLDFLE